MPDQQRAHQPGALRDSDTLDVVQPGAGRAERLPDDRRDQLQVPP